MLCPAAASASLFSRPAAQGFRAVLSFQSIFTSALAKGCMLCLSDISFTMLYCTWISCLFCFIWPNWDQIVEDIGEKRFRSLLKQYILYNDDWPLCGNSKPFSSVSLYLLLLISVFSVSFTLLVSSDLVRAWWKPLQVSRSLRLEWTCHSQVVAVRLAGPCSHAFLLACFPFSFPA